MDIPQELQKLGELIQRILAEAGWYSLCQHERITDLSFKLHKLIDSRQSLIDYQSAFMATAVLIRVRLEDKENPLPARTKNLWSARLSNLVEAFHSIRLNERFLYS